MKRIALLPDDSWEHLSQPMAEPSADSRAAPLFVALPARNQEGSERRHGDHADRDVALILLPERVPEHVDRAVEELDAADADHGEDSHDEREAEREAQPDLLAERDADSP